MGRRLGVLVLVKGLGIGGAEKLISEAAPYWDHERFDYRVGYFLPWKDQLVPDLEKNGVEVKLLGGRRGTDPRTPGRLRRYVAESRIGLVHAHLPAAGIMARLASPVPVVYTEHNLVSSYRPITKILNRVTYGRNRAVTAVSAPVAEEVKRYRGPKVEVVENGVSMEVAPIRVAAVRDELGLKGDYRLVVHVGNIRPYKGHAHLVQTARWLRDQGARVEIVSIGGEKHPGDLERVRDLARQAGVADTIRFLGRRPEARAFLALADAVVNPSDVEGLPVSLLEAMSLGRPVVATAVGGVPSLIDDGISGLLVPPADPVRMGQAVMRVLEDADLAARLGAGGREQVEARYGVRPMVEAFERIYMRVAVG
jgi:glycosyltransferase involved in cell wall biosynthesis